MPRPRVLTEAGILETGDVAPLAGADGADAMTAMFAISSWGASTRFREQIMARSAFPLEGDIVAFLVVNQLVYRGVARPTEIADAVDTGRSNVSKVVSRLESSGLLLRIADPHDGRGVALALTAEGRDVGRRILEATRQLQPLPEDWTTEDGQELERLVVKLARAVNALPRHPPVPGSAPTRI